jgi:phosphate transport system permease protein
VHNNPPVRMVRSHGSGRRLIDRLARKGFGLGATLPFILVLVILATLFLRFLPILQEKSILELLSGQVWKPLRGEFGFLPFILGTLWVTLVAMIIAVPPCLFCAIYLAEYASPATRTVVKPLLDLLAAIPSVVYGVWGMLFIVPLVQNYLGPALDRLLGFLPFFAKTNPTGFSLLSGGIVLAVMVAPFIIAVTYEVIGTVPNGQREAALALGATRWQAIRSAVLPPTASGVAAGVVLGSSRALGETMAVLMVVGNVVQVPKSIFDAAYPLPALIANNYGEMMSIPLYDAALMGAAFILALIVLLFNILSTLVLRRYKKKYQS